MPSVDTTISVNVERNLHGIFGEASDLRFIRDGDTIIVRMWPNAGGSYDALIDIEEFREFIKLATLLLVPS